MLFRSVCHTTGKEADTLEGRIVKLSDKIAYINHDIDDAIVAGVLSEDSIPNDIREALGKSKSDRINTLVMSVINNSGDDIVLGENETEPFSELCDFMFRNVYTNPVCKGEEKKAEALIKTLFDYFAHHPLSMPTEYESIYLSEGAERAACDYVAGMSDSYVLHVYNNLFIPKSWIGWDNL